MTVDYSYRCYQSEDAAINALLNSLWKNENGALRGFKLNVENHALPHIVDGQGRKCATFCFGLEIFELDRWMPINYASFDLKRVEYVKTQLEHRLGCGDIRIVRFERNYNLG